MARFGRVVLRGGLQRRPYGKVARIRWHELIQQHSRTWNPSRRMRLGASKEEGPRWRPSVPSHRTKSCARRSNLTSGPCTDLQLVGSCRLGGTPLSKRRAPIGGGGALSGEASPARFRCDKATAGATRSRFTDGRSWSCSVPPASARPTPLDPGASWPASCSRRLVGLPLSACADANGRTVEKWRLCLLAPLSNSTFTP